MTDQIISNSGQKVGSWNGSNVADLKQELEKIRQELNNTGVGDRLVSSGIPHRDQLPEDLHKFNAYPIWGCDQHNNCLCGARANRIVSVEDVRQFSMIDHH